MTGHIRERTYYKEKIILKNEILVLNGAMHLTLGHTCERKSEKFNNGETHFQLNCSVRHKPVIIIQSFPDPNDNLMELMLAIDAVKMAGASNITCILLTFPYARQDRKHAPGYGISAKVICDMLAAVKVNNVLAIDMHNDAIQGMMNKEVVFDHILTHAFMAYHLKRVIKDIKNYTMISPDAGAIKLIMKVAKLCDIEKIAIIDKTRINPGVVNAMKLIGVVDGEDCIILDDMIDTAGTLAKARSLLFDNGAKSVKFVATHGIFSGQSFSNISDTWTYIINTLPNYMNAKSYNNIEVFNIENFLLDIIDRMEIGGVFSPLFLEWSEYNKVDLNF